MSLSRDGRWIPALAAIALAALVLGAACESQTARSKKDQPRAAAVGPAEQAPVPTLAPSPTKGPETAPVTLVEVSDFQ